MPGSYDNPYIKANNSGNVSLDNNTANGFRLPVLDELCEASHNSSYAK